MPVQAFVLEVEAVAVIDVESLELLERNRMFVAMTFAGLNYDLLAAVVGDDCLNDFLTAKKRRSYHN